MSNTSAVKLTYESLPDEVKKIANDSLGPGVLKSLISYAKTYHLMIKISDGAFIGFALYYFENTRLKNGKNYITGKIEAICVSPAYRREGFGTLLTYSTLRKMSAYGADRVEILLKTPRVFDKDGQPGTPLIGNSKLLEQLGFRQIKVFENYYIDISNKYKYDCILCNSQPDSCKGVLYAINDKVE